MANCEHSINMNEWENSIPVTPIVRDSEYETENDPVWANIFPCFPSPLIIDEEPVDTHPPFLICPIRAASNHTSTHRFYRIFHNSSLCLVMAPIIFVLSECPTLHHGIDQSRTYVQCMHYMTKMQQHVASM